MTQGDLRLEGFLVEFGDVEEQLDRLVRLLVQQVVEAAEVRRRQLADLAIAVPLSATPPDDPAAQRRQGQQEHEPEPLIEEGHAQRPSGLSAGGEPRLASASRRCIGNTTLALITVPPMTTPASNAS